MPSPKLAEKVVALAKDMGLMVSTEQRMVTGVLVSPPEEVQETVANRLMELMHMPAAKKEKLFEHWAQRT
eukprot:1290426-Karenia_brevis.AAC.1